MLYAGPGSVCCQIHSYSTCPVFQQSWLLWVWSTGGAEWGLEGGLGGEARVLLPISISLLWPLQRQMAALPQRVSPAEKPHSDSSFFLVVPAHRVQYHHPSLCSPTWGCSGFLLFPISRLPLHPLSGSQLLCYLRKQFPAVSFLHCKYLKVLSVFLVRPWWYTPTHIHTTSPNTGDLIFSSRTWACTLADHLPLLPPSLVLGYTWVSFSWDLFSLPIAILDGI